MYATCIFENSVSAQSAKFLQTHEVLLRSDPPGLSITLLNKYSL